MDREREKKRERDIVLRYYMYTGYLLSIVKIKREKAMGELKEKEREKATNNIKCDKKGKSSDF